MKQKKYYSDYETFYEVTFQTGEHKDFCFEKPTTHNAIVYSDGIWFHCIMIDGKPANSPCYRSAKSAVKNSWILK